MINTNKFYLCFRSFDTVSSLKCPKCNSEISFADCTERETTQDCGTGNNVTCVSVKMIRHLKKVYQKECTRVDRCTNDIVCGEGTQSCEVREGLIVIKISMIDFIHFVYINYFRGIECIVIKISLVNIELRSELHNSIHIDMKAPVNF